MLSVAEAQAIIGSHLNPRPGGVEALTSAVLGSVLAEPITSDIDSPPFDKALVDGFAVRVADCTSPPVQLRIIEEIPAGATPRHPVSAGEASRILTGAPLPEGADAVLMQEQASVTGTEVHFRGPAPTPGQHILRQGREMRQGDTVLEAGTVLRPQEFGLLAAVGKTAVPVYPAPRVAILSTGDELIEAALTPRVGQIRNSAGPMLVMQVVRAHGLPRYLGIARDQRELLRSLISEGLQTADLVLLSGGVSVGTYDLIPQVLAELGVAIHLHKVAMKPGKPLLFGTTDDRLVFGLPGNPVSSFVCFELFVRPAMQVLRGWRGKVILEERLPLATDFLHRSDRPTYHPARRIHSHDQQLVEPVPWLGSADLRSLTQADTLLVLPAGEHTYAAGEFLPVLPLDPG